MRPGDEDEEQEEDKEVAGTGANGDGDEEEDKDCVPRRPARPDPSASPARLRTTMMMRRRMMTMLRHTQTQNI